ncbi:hypothetical protein [Desulfospira joergensenii]|uniref:hypothetical protein n=1 Tax=Desulfospira joergensenii TaxID=53329 RepID=UPI000487AABC|nr:hypothetical protein [Desulfospira joergensenii]
MTILKKSVPILILICFLGCTDLSWHGAEPGSIMVELPNQAGTFTAKIIASEKPGTYTFKILDLKTKDVLATETISAPVGYHEHIATLIWEDNQNVTAEIDHDFGESKKIFKLKVKTDT